MVCSSTGGSWKCLWGSWSLSWEALPCFPARTQFYEVLLSQIITGSYHDTRGLPFQWSSGWTRKEWGCCSSSRSRFIKSQLVDHSSRGNGPQKPCEETTTWWYPGRKGEEKKGTKADEFGPMWVLGPGVKDQVGGFTWVWGLLWISQVVLFLKLLSFTSKKLLEWGSSARK